jgi:hypothetical protein
MRYLSSGSAFGFVSRARSGGRTRSQRSAHPPIPLHDWRERYEDSHRHAMQSLYRSVRKSWRKTLLGRTLARVSASRALFLRAKLANKPLADYRSPVPSTILLPQAYVPEAPRSGCRNPQEARSSRHPLKPVTFPQATNISLGIRKICPVLPQTNCGEQRLFAPGCIPQILLANGFTGQLRDGSARLPCQNVERFPNIFFQVQLSSPHDV